MDLNRIPAGHNLPWDVNVCIEIPRGTAPVKYEIEKESGALYVDRFLKTAMYYPAHYGFIPHTLGKDGDPLDALVLGEHPLVPGSIIRCRPVGFLMMEDEAGEDQKILMVPISKVTSCFDSIQDYQDVSDVLRDQIAHFFTHYKDLDVGKWARVQGWKTAQEAADLILSSCQGRN